MLIAIEKCRDGCSRGLSHAFKIGENDLRKEYCGSKIELCNFTAIRARQH